MVGYESSSGFGILGALVDISTSKRKGGSVCADNQLRLPEPVPSGHEREPFKRRCSDPNLRMGELWCLGEDSGDFERELCLSVMDWEWIGQLFRDD